MRRLAHNQPNSVALSECGLPISGAPGRILVEGGRVAPKQIRLCRNGLRCAYCSPIQWRVLGEKIDHYGTAHEAQGGRFAHSTLTIPHKAADPLAELLAVLAGSWANLRNHPGFKRERARLDAVPVVALQIKWGPRNGWHPHYHVLWFTNDEDLGGFPEAVEASWVKQTALRGRQATRIFGGDVVRNRLGFWEYLGREDDRHPNKDCLHPDHPGCPACRPGGEFDGQPVEPTPGPRYAPTRGPAYVPTPGPILPTRPDPVPKWNPGRWRPRSAFDIFTEIGSAAVREIDTAHAILRQYIAGTAGVGRVRQLGHLSKRYGPPPEQTRHYEPGGSRLWISGEVVGAVELANRGVGSPLDSIGDPDETAALWSEMTGRKIVTKPADDDGAPMLQFA